MSQYTAAIKIPYGTWNGVRWVYILPRGAGTGLPDYGLRIVSRPYEYLQDIYRTSMYVSFSDYLHHRLLPFTIVCEIPPKFSLPRDGIQ